MRQAMAAAEVGDDVLGDDPTVVALERRTAELLGKRRLLHALRDDGPIRGPCGCIPSPATRVLMEASAHVYLFEAGGSRGLSRA
jgi:threonine aldolase